MDNICLLGVLALFAVFTPCVTAVDVTGYVTSNRDEYGIFIQQLDWFQATEQCIVDGYLGLEVLPELNSKVNLITHTLRVNYSNSSLTFWTGLFRPHSYVTHWYDSGSTPCQTYPRAIVTGDVICNHQCLTLTFDNLFDQITLKAENCSVSYPYICYKTVGPIKYDYFYDYSFTYISSYANYDVHYDVNITVCEDLCTVTGQCVAYTYSQVYNTCTILYLETGYGYMTYTVEPTPQTTHGYKTRLKPALYQNATFTTPPLVEHTLPTCNVSEIPPGYCRCNVSIQINNNTDDSVAELIQNLTVNKDETSKSRRRLTSAEDDRTSAKAVGVVGLGVLLAVIITLFAFDFTLLVEQTMLGIRLLKTLICVGNWKQIKED